MRIGIDARFYGSLGKGLGRYVAELIAAYERLDEENEYVVFLREANAHEYVPANPRFTKVIAEFPWYGWKEQLVYPLFLLQHRVDLMHFPHFNVPLLYPRPFVVTVHDLILLRHPTTRATTLGPLRFRIKFLLYRLVIGMAIARARAVITVSEWSKRDIERHFPAAKNKIHVTLEAVSKRVSRTTATRREGTPFALYVGNAYPHKNLERLVSAFALFRKTHPDHRLVLVGGRDYFYERLARETETRGLADNVEFRGHVNDDELAELYETASFYVFPSLHEGFGLPPLEAMAHGLPVAAARATCLPEILGDAAEWFDPEDERSIAQAMTRLADDPERRTALAAEGRKQVEKYDWDECGERTLTIYARTTRHDA